MADHTRAVAAGVPDEHESLPDDRRHRQLHARTRDVELHVPNRVAVDRIEREDMRVRRSAKDASVHVRDAAIHRRSAARRRDVPRSLPLLGARRGVDRVRHRVGREVHRAGRRRPGRPAARRPREARRCRSPSSLPRSTGRSPRGARSDRRRAYDCSSANRRPARSAPGCPRRTRPSCGRSREERLRRRKSVAIGRSGASTQAASLRSEQLGEFLSTRNRRGRVYVR